MKKFIINGKAFQAEDCVDGVLVNPKLPKHFDNTPNDARPESQRKWWGLPYITTHSDKDMDPANDMDKYAEERRKLWADTGRAAWFAAWPSGVRYSVRCLDGGAWDRSTNWGSFAALNEALQCAGAGPAWRR